MQGFSRSMHACTASATHKSLFYWTKTTFLIKTHSSMINMCNLKKKNCFQTSSYSPLFWKMGKVGETGARPFQAEIESHSRFVRRIQQRRCSPFQNRVPLREMALLGIQTLTNQAAESVWNGQKSCLGFTTSAGHGSARQGQVHFSSIPTARACSDEWFHS